MSTPSMVHSFNDNLLLMIVLVGLLWVFKLILSSVMAGQEIKNGSWIAMIFALIIEGIIIGIFVLANLTK